MRSKKYPLVLGITALFIGSVILAENLKKRVIVDQESLKVLVGEKFPEDLNCEIFVGPNGSPTFRTEGQQKRIKSAAINIPLGPSVEVIRKEADGDSYFLYLFREDEQGKVIGFFDLNFDGTWDVKKSPTRKQNFILADGRWLEVTRIDGILSAKPTAEIQGQRYEFRGSWTTIK